MKITLNNKSLLDIRSEFPDLFYDQSWYDGQAFAQEKITGTWDVDLEPVKDSTNKSWSEQQALLKEGDEVPPAAVLAYAILTHFKKTGNRAFEHTYARTSSVDSGGHHVYLGSFDAEGLGVSSYWDNGRDSGLGLASSRKVEAGTSNIDLLESSIPESLVARIERLEATMEAIRKALV